MQYYYLKLYTKVTYHMVPIILSEEDKTIENEERSTGCQGLGVKKGKNPGVCHPRIPLLASGRTLRSNETWLPLKKMDVASVPLV